MKNFASLSDAAALLKSEAAKLRDEFDRVHADHLAANAELSALDHSPPHRAELETLLATALDQVATVHRRNLEALIHPWLSATHSGRAESRQGLVNHVAQSADFIPALEVLLLREQLPAIVASMDWTEAMKPAEREAMRVEIEKRLSVIRDRLTELSTLATDAGISLRN